MKAWHVCIGLLVCLSSQTASVAQTRCEVNWDYSVYIAEGQAVVQNAKLKQSREQALLNARKSANDSMLSLIYKTSISGKDSASILAANPVLKRKILSQIAAAKPVASRFVQINRKSVAIVTLKIPVFGPNTPGTAILAGSSNGVAKQFAATTIDESQDSIIGSGAPGYAPTADNSTGGYTSLILDATGYQVKRSMCPRILRPNNEVVWNGEDTSVEQVEEFGIAAYVRSIDAANRNPRCGLRPLVVRVQGVAGIQSWDVVVSDSDARVIMDRNSCDCFLDKLNVIIVTD